MRKLVALLACTMLALTACSYGASDGGSKGTNNPVPQASYCVPESGNCNQSAPQQPTAPIPTADAATLDPNPEPEIGNQPLPSLPFRECVLNLDPEGTGIRLYQGLFAQGIFHVVCVKAPTSIIVVARLERLHGGRWLDEADILADPALPRLVPAGRYAGFFKRDYHIQALCYPGTWRLDVQWFGIKADGTSGFGSQAVPVPADNWRTNC